MIFETPAVMNARKSSGDRPVPPCSTTGMSAISRIRLTRSTSSFGSAWYRPCAVLKSNAKDVCIEEAKAKEKVAKAELEFAFTGKPADANKVLVAKASTAYAVAKERCDDQAGNAKDVCMKEAKAIEVKALAEAKMGKEITEARKDAKADSRDADYKVAIEKCDAMAGDAKASCVAAAKVKFGKS